MTRDEFMNKWVGGAAFTDEFVEDLDALLRHTHAAGREEHKREWYKLIYGTPPCDKCGIIAYVTFPENGKNVCFGCLDLTDKEKEEMRARLGTIHGP